MSFLAKQGLSQKSRRNVYSLSKLLFDVAVDNDLVFSSPIRPKLYRPKLAGKEKSVMSLCEGRRLLQSVASGWGAPVTALALTGLRSGELLALRWQNVDFLRKRITVTHSLWRGRLFEPKTSSSKRVLGLCPELAQVFVEHRASSDFTSFGDFVFCKEDGCPLDPDSLRRDGIYPALEKAGIPFVKRASGCHAFRHLAASLIHEETRSLKLAQIQLGHSAVSTTANIYTHVEEETRAEIACILGKQLGRSVVGNVVQKGSGEETVQ